MRITCPICGARDLREFTYRGDAILLDRPSEDAGPEAFIDYVHLRDNPAGEHDELWHHAMGCSAWLQVRRNTVSHEILSVALAREVR
ncbi:MAG: sarcosine oxidase subunit delta [Pseudomonadota bacterium]